MEGVPYKSIPDMLRGNAKRFKEKPALKYKYNGRYITLTYEEFYNRALLVARGLRKFGIKKGEKVAILSENRAGWVIADMGIQCAGAVTVPIYPTNTPEQVEYVINHSDSVAIFISTKIQYEKLLKIKDKIPNIRHVFSFDRFIGEKDLPVMSLHQLSEIDTPLTEQERKEIEAIIDSLGDDDLITIIYTSGTTGVPKGVMLTQGNICFDAYYGIKKVENLVTENDIFLSFLPLSHSLERTVGYYICIMSGALMAFAESVEKVPENMLEVKPTLMVSVPRLFEKIYARILDNVHTLPEVRKKIFHWAVKVGKEYVHRKYIEKKSLGFLKTKYAIADKLVFSKVRERFGGRMRFFVSGGAPLDKNINEFFWAIGVPIFEGYGLTETSPAVCINNLSYVRFGSVGTPFEKTYIKTAEDGEILIKGPQVMKGYYKNEEATKEVMEDGWFKTGDIGVIDKDGFLYITDRKKELIITAGGKNIAPQPIENELKMDKFISQAFVYGDRKPYLTALIVPNFERLVAYARENHIKYIGMDDLVKNEKVIKLYEERIANINSKLAKYETIKKFTLLPIDFTIDGGELTPTLKLKRKAIYNKYKDKIESMYL